MYSVYFQLDTAINQPTTPEYLASLPPAIQSALASRSLLFSGGLNLNEALAAMAAAQRGVPAEAVRYVNLKLLSLLSLSFFHFRSASVEGASTSDAARNAVPIYQCVPCGIRFSSLSTLEAHQTYYCSHR